MAKEKFVPITEEQARRLTEEFLRELRLKMQSEPHQLQHLIVIGGSPGSGKTTCARKMAEASKSWHVQANSARYLLGRHGLPWGMNVHLLLWLVIHRLLETGVSVTVDGMLTEEMERQAWRELAAQHAVPVFLIAIRSEPVIAERWAARRYADGKESTFDDWRAKPEKYDEYIKSIRERLRILDANLWGVPEDIIHGVHRIDNDGSKEGLLADVSNAWDEIEQFFSARGLS